MHEKKVAHLKDQRVKTANLLAAYTERLEQLDQSHADLNQTISDLSISLPNLIADANKMEKMAEAKAGEKAEAEAEKKATQEVIMAFLAEQEASEAVEETTTKERLGKKVTSMKKKEAADPSKDIYLDAFHVGTSFEMLGDLAQLEAWWRKKQQGNKLMKNAQQAPVATAERKVVHSKRSAPTSFKRKGLLKSE